MNQPGGGGGIAISWIRTGLHACVIYPMLVGTEIRYVLNRAMIKHNGIENVKIFIYIFGVKCFTRHN